MNKYLLKKFNKIERYHWWWKGRQNILKMFIPDKKNLKILDIGCGTGETILFLNGYLKQPNITGLDSSKLAIKFCKERNLNVKNSNATKLPFKSCSFDCVLLLDVLEHINDDGATLIEARRVLKDGGRIYITVPALQFIWSDHDTGQGHKRRYSLAKMNKVSTMANLKVIKSSYFNFFLSPIIIIVRVIGNIFPFTRLNEYDSKINYNVAKHNILNSILSRIFITETSLLKNISLPFGISIFTILEKQ